MRKTKLMNGQVWANKKFPCFTTMILMLPSQPGGNIRDNLLWCRVGIGGHPPIILTEMDGKWMFCESEMKRILEQHKYTLTKLKILTLVRKQEKE